jgi:hypothetical protein
MTFRPARGPRFATISAPHEPRLFLLEERPIADPEILGPIARAPFVPFLLGERSDGQSVPTLI